MDEEKKEGMEGAGRTHVHIFGAEVNGSAGDRAARHEEWKARREEWKHARKEQREEWKAWRRECRDDHPHTGGMFWGLLILFAGIVALLYSMGLVPPLFWHAIEPLWPLLLIIWGASIVLGRHWLARLVLFILAFILFVAAIMYGLVRANSPLVSSLSPTVVQAIEHAPIHQQ